MFIGKEVISYNNNLYELVRVFREKENFPITEAKEYYNCDTTLKKEGILYFCRLIEEAQIIEETKHESIQLVEEKQEAEAPTEEGSPKE